MIDNKKIGEAALDYCAECTDTTNRNINLDKDECVDLYNGFKEGAHWAINKFLRDLFHAACEVPWNDNGKVLSFSREIGYRKLYDVNAMLDKTTCNTYKEMWEKEVKAYRWSDWIYVDELFGLITKGGKK